MVTLSGTVDFLSCSFHPRIGQKKPGRSGGETITLDQDHIATPQDCSSVNGIYRAWLAATRATSSFIVWMLTIVAFCLTLANMFRCCLAPNAGNLASWINRFSSNTIVLEKWVLPHHTVRCLVQHYWNNCTGDELEFEKGIRTLLLKAAKGGNLQRSLGLRRAH